MIGTEPQGASSEAQASGWVREMFGRIAPRYDLVNHLLSFNLDRYWRRRVVNSAADLLSRPDSLVLDLCCGTGDLAVALSRRTTRPVIASDFSHPMLRAAKRKSLSLLLESDALMLPLRDASVDLITCAFGFRNLANYRNGLREFRRVLRPGGRLAILEFSHPPNPVFAYLYQLYSRRILPVIGGLFTGSPDAYRYLPESVRKFPGPTELRDWFSDAGFANPRFETISGGIVALHLGDVP